MLIMKKVAVPILVIVFLSLAWAGEKKAERFAELKFTILKDANGEPVRSASVVLHPLDEKGRPQRTGIQLKTDSDGNTGFPSVAYGKLRVQVIARGFQTFGEDYDINQPTQEIVIRLKRPQEQYSIYK